MEIKLKTTPPVSATGAIVDEYGVSWNLSGAKVARDIFLATAQGPDGASIGGFYKNGALFIVNLSDAKKYFSSGHLYCCALKLVLT
jgi:hypothetical protein